MTTLKLVCVVLMSMVLLAPLGSEAVLQCAQVTGNLATCIPYLRRNVRGGPPAPCCNGVRRLNSAARTTPDRQAACFCLQRAASSISGIDYGLASSLPKYCRVFIPYQISPSTNCNNVK